MVTRRTKQRARRPEVCAVVMLLPLLKVNMIELHSQIGYLLDSYESYSAAQQVQKYIDGMQGSLSSSEIARSMHSTWLMLHPLPLQFTLDARPQLWAKYEKSLAYHERLTQAMIESIVRLVCEV